MCKVDKSKNFSKIWWLVQIHYKNSGLLKCSKVGSLQHADSIKEWIRAQLSRTTAGLDQGEIGPCLASKAKNSSNAWSPDSSQLKWSAWLPDHSKMKSNLNICLRVAPIKPHIQPTLTSMDQLCSSVHARINCMRAQGRYLRALSNAICKVRCSTK